MSSGRSTTFRLNGRDVSFDGPAATRVLDVLRDRFGLTGTKDGCGAGECGACSILVDGEPLLSCLLLVGEIDGSDVSTIEGRDDPHVESMRQAFLEEGALQCGFCSPGMIVAASRIPSGAGEEEIRTRLVGNLCRCTGYASIVRAVQRAHRGAGGSP